MTPRQVQLVRETWPAVEAIGPAAASLFYERLFATEPTLRALFRGDIDAQGKKLVAMLAAAIGALDRIDTLVPTLHALGRRHVGYGVEPAHYDAVGAALLWTLERGLGGAFSDDVRLAWSAVYAALASAMQASDHGHAAAA
jgi:hemoglobin-like flavoprotein